MALTDKLTTIANAIRSKTGKSDALTLDQMATEIESISAGGSTEEWIGDGNTHIWITLGEGRTSPMLGCYHNGTVTVDWGDGTTPDTLTATTSALSLRWTPTHNYAKAGDYIITLTADGEIEFCGMTSKNNYAYILRHSERADAINVVYANAVKKVELGDSVTKIGDNAFRNCFALSAVNIPGSVTSIGNDAFTYCTSLSSVNIPDSVTSIGDGAFYYCSALSSVNIPDGVTSISNSAFYHCTALPSVNIPDSVTSIGNNAFYYCSALASVNIPDSVMSIGNSAFYDCDALSSVIIPGSVMSIGSGAFDIGLGVRFYDFSKHTAVPTLSASNSFSSPSVVCEIRVPAALYDEWIAATNWSTYADKIVAV